jgi:hypothetical protein
MGEPEKEKEQTCYCCPHLWKPENEKFVMVICYDLAPPPPHPHPLVSKLVWRHRGRLSKRDNLLMGEGGWVKSLIIRRRESLLFYTVNH